MDAKSSRIISILFSFHFIRKIKSDQMPVERGTDEKGPFYRWGQHGKKYRYTSGNKRGREMAKRRANKQARAIFANYDRRRAQPEEEQEGGFLKYFFPVLNALPEVRTGAPPNVREWIKKKDGIKITNVSVIRNPLTSKFKTILNWITLGDFNKKIKKENYDDIFHLFMILRFQDGSHLRVDKNHVVEISTRIEGVQEKGGAQMNAGSPNCSLEEFFRKGEYVAGGPKPMWVYSPVSPRWNCQAFVSWCLSGSRLLTPALDKFINQNAESLVSGGIAQKFLGSLTNLAAKIDVVRHGKGIKKPIRKKK